MDNNQLLRYARHILLEDIGIEGQNKLLQSHVLIIGAGGLGSPAALYLGAAGVGQLTLVDHDTVDLSNLQRQIAHTTARVGQAKVASASKTLQAINPQIKVSCIHQKADGILLNNLVKSADVVLDCSDNFVTRHAINAACIAHKKPLVAAAALQFDGQISVYDSRQPHCPCYACIFPPQADFNEVQCSTMGVFAPIVGIMGSMQAAEALKLLCNIGTSLAGRLLMLDGRSMAWTEMQIERDASCTVCG